MAVNKNRPMMNYLGATFLLMVIISTPVPKASAYCWEPGKNPAFTGPPVVEQLNMRKVRVSWFGLVTMRECADQFLVKYWLRSTPNKYKTTDLVSNNVSVVEIEVTPKVMYEFQAVAREDKGLIGGIDWNKSPSAEFKTSQHQKNVDKISNVIPVITQNDVKKPEITDIINTDKPKPVPNEVIKKDTTSESKSLKINLELICIIAVCGVVLVLILIGIMYKLACAKKSSECEVYDDEEEDDEDADEKEKLEV